MENYYFEFAWLGLSVFGSKREEDLNEMTMWMRFGSYRPKLLLNRRVLSTRLLHAYHAYL